MCAFNRVLESYYSWVNPKLVLLQECSPHVFLVCMRESRGIISHGYHTPPPTPKRPSLARSPAGQDRLLELIMYSGGFRSIANDVQQPLSCASGGEAASKGVRKEVEGVRKVEGPVRR